MENKKYISYIIDGVNYLTEMCFPNELDIETITIELDSIQEKLKRLASDIKRYTPTKEDLLIAQTQDKMLLTSHNSELSSLEYSYNDLLEKMQKLCDHLIEYETLEKDLIAKKEVLNKQLITFKSYTGNSREFKNFINDIINEIKAIDEELKTISLSKTRENNAISVLRSQIDELKNSIEQIKDKIALLEQKLTTTKEYEDVKIIKDKKAIKESYEKQQKDLRTRKAELENSPVYLSQQIKKKVEGKKDYNLVIKLLDQMLEIALKQPYMSTVIRGGNIDELENEYKQKTRQKAQFERKINKEDYSLDSLSSEECRISDLEKLINYNDGQIESAKSALDKNKVAISSLITSFNKLKDNYESNQKDVSDYLESVNLEENSKEKAKKQKEYSKMQHVLEVQYEILSKYKNNIGTLVEESNLLNEQISSYSKQNKDYEKEIAMIRSVQMRRHNYVDVIRQNKDINTLDEMSQELAYLKNRLKYKNYNVKQLGNEIKNALKILYKVNTKTIESLGLEEVEPKIADELSQNQIATLDDLLHENNLSSKAIRVADKVSHREISNMVDDIEESLNTFFKVTDNSIDLNNDDSKEEKDMKDNSLNELLDYVANSFDKVNSSKKKVNLNIEDIPKEKDTFLDFSPIKSYSENVNSASHQVMPTSSKITTLKNAKKKVIAVEKIFADSVSMNNIINKTKVIKVEKLVEKKPIKPVVKDLDAKDNNIDVSDAFNLVYNPFSPESEEVTLKRAA